MDIFFTTIQDFLDSWIPSGSTHATDWYTLNEMVAYLFSLVIGIGIFALIFYVMFWLPVGLVVKRRPRS